MSQVNPHEESLRVAKENLASAEQNINQASDAFNAAQAEVNAQQEQHDAWQPTPEEQSEGEGEAPEGETPEGEMQEGEAVDATPETPQPEEPAQEGSEIDEVQGQTRGIVDAVEDLVNQVTDEQVSVVTAHAQAAGITINDKFDAVKYLVASKSQ